jgi:hypothetical protein
LRLERQRLKTHLGLVDLQAQEISQALGLAVCPIAGEVFDEAKHAHLLAIEPASSISCSELASVFRTRA